MVNPGDTVHTTTTTSPRAHVYPGRYNEKDDRIVETEARTTRENGRRSTRYTELLLQDQEYKRLSSADRDACPSTIISGASHRARSGALAGWAVRLRTRVGDGERVDARTACVLREAAPLEDHGLRHARGRRRARSRHAEQDAALVGPVRASVLPAGAGAAQTDATVKVGLGLGRIEGRHGALPAGGGAVTLPALPLLLGRARGC